MPLTYSPRPGTIVMCDFTSGFRPPEMVKKRPVVVVSPRRRRSNLVVVVPLSSTKPAPLEPWHHALRASTYPPARSQMWAKCDVLNSVGLDRLDRIKTRDAQGNRRYETFTVPAPELAEILSCVRAGLGFR
ncbi:MAG: type II toxin-antitoxin system PemK/MazF family toxin [Rhodospirillaceae bacterium]|nr:type II toxin-antitoxin system PemK/MazF family toxin [Rhodospirillaceae bacterium]